MIDYVNSATQKRLPPRAELQIALNLIPAEGTRRRPITPEL